MRAGFTKRHSEGDRSPEAVRRIRTESTVREVCVAVFSDEHGPALLGIIVLEGDVTSSNYENYNLKKDTKNIILTNNKGQAVLKTSPVQPVCGEHESLSDFAERYQKWNSLVSLAADCLVVR